MPADDIISLLTVIVGQPPCSGVRQRNFDLKKPQRIEALSMVMVLTLMVYSVAEWKLRERLKETEETIPDQVKKQTQKPTLKWAFMLMREITEVKMEMESKVITQIANMDDVKSKIIRLMGKNCEKYYF